MKSRLIWIYLCLKLVFENAPADARLWTARQLLVRESRHGFDQASYGKQFTSDVSWPNINHNKKRTLLSLLQNFENGVACVEEWKTEWQQWGLFFAMILSAKNIQKGKWSVIHVQILQQMTNKHWRTGSGLFSDIPNFLNCVILFSNMVLNSI